MSEYLQMRVEFPRDSSHGGLTSEELSDSVRSIFLETGIDESAVSAGVEKVRLAGPLALDPGTAAVLVALIGVSVELIKLGVESLKQDEELKLKRRELELKEQEFEAQKAQTGMLEEGKRELIQEFVERLLLARLLERHNIQPTTVVVELKDR
jgi:hypothetical protein